MMGAIAVRWGRRQARSRLGPGAAPCARRKAESASRLRPASPLCAALALAGLLGLAGCTQAENIHPFASLSKIDPLGALQRLNQPGLLGSLIDRKPPPVTLRASGPYPGPLSSAMPPVLTPELADRVVAEPLRASLTPAARMDLAQASMLAAAAATGTAVPWKAAEAQGIVAPAADVYISPHGLVCRDLRQIVDEANTSKIEPMTLCRENIDADQRAWRPMMTD